MHLRELIDADLPALYTLCQSSLPYDQLTPDLLQRRVFADPQPGPHFRLAMWHDSKLVGAVVGLRRVADQQLGGGILLLVVDPQLRRRGIADQLLQALESQMHAAGVANIVVGGTGPNYFWPGVDMRYTPAYCLFQKRGYQTDEIRVNQLVDLASQSWETQAVEAKLAEEGFLVRRLEQTDRQDLISYMQGRWSQGWLDEVLLAYQNDPVSAFVALQHGQLCGFAACNIAGFAGNFGPTGTNEDLRGRGLGRVLFYRCMNDFQQRGMAFSEVGWVGPIAFYSHIAGAYVHRAFWAMHKLLIA